MSVNLQMKKGCLEDKVSEKYDNLVCDEDLENGLCRDSQTAIGGVSAVLLRRIHDLIRMIDVFRQCHFICNSYNTIDL